MHDKRQDEEDFANRYEPSEAMGRLSKEESHASGRQRDREPGPSKAARSASALSIVVYIQYSLLQPVLEAALRLALVVHRR